MTKHRIFAKSISICVLAAVLGLLPVSCAKSSPLVTVRLISSMYFAARRDATIHGYVTSDNSPLTRCDIRLTAVNNPSESFVTRLDDFGYFEFPSVSGGTYDIDFPGCYGIKPEKTQVTVPKSETRLVWVEVVLTLPGANE